MTKEIKPDENGPMAFLKNKYPHIFYLVDDYLKIQKIIRENLEGRKIPTGSLPDIKTILFANFNKATDSLTAVLWLCTLGLTKDAFTILRKIQELAIHMKYICKDKQHNTALYINYFWLARRKNLLDILSNFDSVSTKFSKQDLEEQLRETNQKIEENKALYKLDKNNKICKRYFDIWSGKNNREMARECNIDYLGFKVGSKYTHVSIEDINAYYREGDFLIKLDGDDIPLIILYSLLMYHQILEILDAEYNLSLTASLKYLNEKLEANAKLLNADN